MPVTFVDVVALVVDYLNDNLTPSVYTRVPNPRPDTFVRVQRTGGTSSSLRVDDATVVVESWALKDEDAYTLAASVRSLLHALASTSHNSTQIYRVDEFSGPGLLPDPVSNHARYTQTFVVQTRGTAA